MHRLGTLWYDYSLLAGGWTGGGAGINHLMIAAAFQRLQGQSLPAVAGPMDLIAFTSGTTPDSFAQWFASGQLFRDGPEVLRRLGIEPAPTAPMEPALRPLLEQAGSSQPQQSSTRDAASELRPVDDGLLLGEIDAAAGSSTELSAASALNRVAASADDASRSRPGAAAVGADVAGGKLAEGGMQAADWERAIAHLSELRRAPRPLTPATRDLVFDGLPQQFTWRDIAALAQCYFNGHDEQREVDPNGPMAGWAHEAHFLMGMESLEDNRGFLPVIALTDRLRSREQRYDLDALLKSHRAVYDEGRTEARSALDSAKSKLQMLAARGPGAPATWVAERLREVGALLSKMASSTMASIKRIWPNVSRPSSRRVTP